MMMKATIGNPPVRLWEHLSNKSSTGRPAYGQAQCYQHPDDDNDDYNGDFDYYHDDDDDA